MHYSDFSFMGATKFWHTKQYCIQPLVKIVLENSSLFFYMCCALNFSWTGMASSFIAVYASFLQNYLSRLHFSQQIVWLFYGLGVESYLKFFLLFLLNKLSFSDTTVIEGGRERKHS